MSNEASTLEMLDLVLGATGGVLWELQLEQGELFPGHQWFMMMGLPLDTHTQEFSSDTHVHPEDFDDLEKKLKQGIKNDKIFSFDTRLKGPNDSWRIIRTTGKTTARDDENNALRVIGVNTDITEEKINEDIRLRSVSLLNAQHEASPDGILIVDETGKVNYYNKLFGAIWELSPETGKDRDTEVINFLRMRLIDPTVLDELITKIEQTPKETISAEMELVNGVTLGCQTSPVISSAGKYYGRIWNFRLIPPHGQSELSTKDEITHPKHTL